MTSWKGLARWAALAAVALGVSGCALPPIVTVASVAADIVSYGETGKSVTDHGISMVLQKDCALLRVFQGAVCSPHPPAEDALEDTPGRVLVALAPLSDPRMVSAAPDPMVLPRGLAYLEGASGLAVASAGAAGSLGQARLASFSGRSGNLAAPPRRGPDRGAGLGYLKAGIDG